MKLPSGRWLRMPGLCVDSMCPCHLLKKLKLTFRSQRNKTENSLLSLNKNVHILSCDNEISVDTMPQGALTPFPAPPSRCPAQVLQVALTALSTLEAKNIEPLPRKTTTGQAWAASHSQWSSAYHCSPTGDHSSSVTPAGAGFTSDPACPVPPQKD